MSGGELMNIRHLEIIEAVEQTGTFTGAAKKLHLTQ
ncbi:LysR family transcriptional regulator, partial [Faecalicatena contorta]